MSAIQTTIYEHGCGDLECWWDDCSLQPIQIFEAESIDEPIPTCMVHGFELMYSPLAEPIDCLLPNHDDIDQTGFLPDPNAPLSF